MNSWHIIAIMVFFTIVVTNHVYAYNEKTSLRYDDQYKTSATRMMYHDLSTIDLKITNTQVLSMDDTPGYETDDSNLIKITISVMNDGPDRFVVQDKMFEIWIMEASKKSEDGFNVVDNYDTTYDDEFEVRYEKMNSRELYNECDQTIESIQTGESLDFTLCYDILKSINKGDVNLGGSRKYMLVMMDNAQSTSCPNCKKIILQNDSGQRTQIMPKWVSKLSDWKSRHLISEKEFQQSMDYLVNKGVMRGNKKPADALDEKNKELASYQHALSGAYNSNLFVSAIQMMESKGSDGFTGMICKKQNNVITLDADYTSDDAKYKVIFFRLRVFDSSGNVAIDGLSKIVNVAPKSFRHLSISAPAVQNPSYCTVGVDSKFS